MSQQHKYLFDRDFRDASSQGRRSTDVDRAQAEANGYARGLEEGRRATENEIQARLSDAAQRLVADADQLFTLIDAARMTAAEEAAKIALAFARKIAGEAIRRDPLGTLEEAANACFMHLRGVPHLVARVNTELVERAEALLTTLSAQRGYEGRIVVLGDPAIACGDARLEWADGGLIRDARMIERTIDDAVAHWIATRTAEHDDA